MKIGPLRTKAEKQDLEASWLRSDFEFFAAGACHVLASAFLGEYPNLGYCAILIESKPPQRGTHVVVANTRWVFDANGFTEREPYFQEYFALQRERDPSWSAALVELDEDPAGWDFCRRRGHRHPSQFWRDPTERARAFIASFALALPRK